MVAPDVETAHSLRARLLTGEVTAEAVLERTLQAADAVDPLLHAFVHRLDDRARDAAAESDRRLGSGTARPLEGLPLTVKDTLWLAGVEAADGSRARASFVAPLTNVAVARAEAAGAVVFAKTANPEFCYHGYTRSELYGPTVNPWRLDRTPGGSSGGAGAALAAGIGPLALGTDGGGSLRIPAAFCGVCAHKPTNGLVPHWPDVAAWPSLSVIGPMARCVDDLELLLSVIAGYEGADLMSTAGPPQPPLHTTLTDLRVAADLDRDGVVPMGDDVARCFAGVVDRLRNGGAKVIERGPERASSGVREWLPIATVEARVAQATEYHERRLLLGEDTRAFLAFADSIGSREYADCQRRRIAIHQAYVEAFERSRTQVLITPALGLEAFALDVLCPAEVAGVSLERPWDDWQGHLWDANLAGLPACTIPMGLGAEGLPLGLQILGRRFADRQVLAAARAIESLLAVDRPAPAWLGASGGDQAHDLEQQVGRVQRGEAGGVE